MKNLLKFSFAIIIISITLYSCSEDETVEQEPQMTEVESLAFFKENISIFDARVRTLNETSFVKELYLANFSDKSWDRNQIGFDNIVFQDNGEGNDLVANDGIFTSVKKFNFNEKVTYRKDVKTLSVMDVIVTAPEFKYSNKLIDLKSKYEMQSISDLDNNSGEKAGPKAEITCDVEICSSGCIADWIWDGFGCICVSDCSVTIGWG
ncbi:hypothetical protein [Psychroserpens sp. NJDZ02]|uniref:hypothetical protein n=1 Tax=Psychroserpens sp. NJDZ02 TaxID=2570561 RepID=UPI0010A7BFD0|nr:hypothetical protein [Psychroserpens sp. NJDZ02]QCE43054.1 hypothetical protein E9099_17055 [Psychroserpens sp. NJDZ02]